MGETWGCIYKTGHTWAASLPESPCVHMHEATWHNSPTVTVMDTTPSGDEYIRRGGEEGTRTCNRLSIIPLSFSLSPSAFTAGLRETFSNDDLYQNSTATSTVQHTTKSKIWHNKGKTSIAGWSHIKHSLWGEKISPWTRLLPDFSVDGLWIFMVLTVPPSSAPFSTLYLGTVSPHSRCTICQAFSSSESCNFKKQKDH